MRYEERRKYWENPSARYFPASSANAKELQIFFSLFLSMTLIVRTLSNDKNLSNAE